jgi:hypothetical protein
MSGLPRRDKMENLDFQSVGPHQRGVQEAFFRCQSSSASNRSPLCHAISLDQLAQLLQRVASGHKTRVLLEDSVDGAPQRGTWPL